MNQISVQLVGEENILAAQKIADEYKSRGVAGQRPYKLLRYVADGLGLVSVIVVDREDCIEVAVYLGDVDDGQCISTTWVEKAKEDQILYVSNICRNGEINCVNKIF